MDDTSSLGDYSISYNPKTTRKARYKSTRFAHDPLFMAQIKQKYNDSKLHIPC